MALTNLDLIAQSVAETLFPHLAHDGLDCRNERGREGQPCTVCAECHQDWIFKIAEVKAALAPHIPEQKL